MKKTFIFPDFVLWSWLLLLCTATTEVRAQGGGALFVPGPVMDRTRIEPFLATLSDGRVVAFGGREFNFVSCSYADIYDPATNAFTEVAMNFPHDNGYVLKLADGRYFILGGAQNLGVAPGYSSTEMFYPSGNTFVPSGSMNYARMWESAVQLTNGNVLIAGAWYNTPGATYGEVYDTTAHTYTLTNAMIQPRANPLMLPANDGGAVIFGGYPSYGGSDYTSVEYFNPADNSFHAVSSEIFTGDPGWLVSGTPYHRRPCSDFRMSNGKYLILGSNSVSGQYGLLTFDPATKAFDKIVLTAPLTDVYSDGGFYDFVLDRTNNLAYLLAADSGYVPVRVSLVAVNLATGFVYHAGSTSTLGASEYPMSTMAFMPTNGKIILEGISSASGDYFHATNKTYLITPQPALFATQVTAAGRAILCYPNPANDVLCFSANGGFSGNISVVIYDMTGRILTAKDFAGSESTVSISIGNIPPGLYFYGLNDNGVVTRDKFIKY